MLKVSEKAATLLWEIQEDKQPCGMTFRLVEKRDGVGLAFDTPQGDDPIFTSQGHAILCVSPIIAEYASDVTIDVEETLP